MAAGGGTSACGESATAGLAEEVTVVKDKEAEKLPEVVTQEREKKFRDSRINRNLLSRHGFSEDCPGCDAMRTQTLKQLQAGMDVEYSPAEHAPPEPPVLSPLPPQAVPGVSAPLPQTAASSALQSDFAWSHQQQV